MKRVEGELLECNLEIFSCSCDVREHAMIRIKGFVSQKECAVKIEPLWITALTHSTQLLLDMGWIDEVP